MTYCSIYILEPDQILFEDFRYYYQARLLQHFIFTIDPIHLFLLLLLLYFISNSICTIFVWGMRKSVQPIVPAGVVDDEWRDVDVVRDDTQRRCKLVFVPSQNSTRVPYPVSAE